MKPKPIPRSYRPRNNPARFSRTHFSQLHTNELALLNSWVEGRMSTGQIVTLCAEHFRLVTNRTTVWRYRNRYRLASLHPLAPFSAQASAEFNRWAATGQLPFTEPTLLLLKHQAFELALSGKKRRRLCRLLRLILSAESLQLRQEQLQFTCRALPGPAPHSLMGLAPAQPECTKTRVPLPTAPPSLTSSLGQPTSG